MLTPFGGEKHTYVTGEKSGIWKKWNLKNQDCQKGMSSLTKLCTFANKKTKVQDLMYKQKDES